MFMLPPSILVVEKMNQTKLTPKKLEPKVPPQDEWAQHTEHTTHPLKKKKSRPGHNSQSTPHNSKNALLLAISCPPRCIFWLCDHMSEYRNTECLSTCIKQPLWLWVIM